MEFLFEKLKPNFILKICKCFNFTHSILIFKNKHKNPNKNKEYIFLSVLHNTIYFNSLKGVIYVNVFCLLGKTPT
jgi:hypothetical protein